MQATKTFEELERGNKTLKKSTDNDSKSHLQSIVIKALDFIEKCIEASSNPVCLCSFGKDSLVMLHLILQVKKVPVIYWREPFFQEKFEYPYRIAREWDLDLYDYPPAFMDYLQEGEYFDVYNFYHTGNQSFMNLFTGTRDYKHTDKKFLCAVKDLLGRPRCHDYEFKWDCIFHGHKAIDKLYITKKDNLSKVYLYGNGILALVLRDWTDKDVWNYIHEYNVPYNKDRYDNQDENANNDLFPTCHDCIDLDLRGKTITCPKTGEKMINNGKSKDEHKKFKDFILEKTYKE